MSGDSVERILNKMDTEISEYLIFAGVLDNNAKLLSFRKGKASFSLPIERHDTLDVQLSLMFSLLRQLEDISGFHRFTVTRFTKHDIFLFGTSELHVFVITTPNSEGHVVKSLAELVASMSQTGSQRTASEIGNRTRDETLHSAMLSTATHQDKYESGKLGLATVSKPEIILVLQGYMMAVEPSCAIHADSNGYYKIKAGVGNKLPWLALQKIDSTFRDRIEIHHVGLDEDGTIFARISLR
jgi:hypothetical protein